RRAPKPMPAPSTIPVPRAGYAAARDRDGSVPRRAARRRPARRSLPVPRPAADRYGAPPPPCRERRRPRPSCRPGPGSRALRPAAGSWDVEIEVEAAGQAPQRLALLLPDQLLEAGQDRFPLGADIGRSTGPLEQLTRDVNRGS